MRIVLLFVLGVILAFYLMEVPKILWRNTQIFKKFWELPHLHHSAAGLLLFVTSLLILFLGGDLLGNPTHILLGTFLLGSSVGMLIHHLLSEQFIISEKIEKDFIKRHETVVERSLEILPGALTWLALTSPLWLSLTLPFAVAYLIILADIYWLFNALKIAILIYLGYRKMTWAKNQPWLKKLQENFPDKWPNYYHLLILPTYKEGLEVLSPAFLAIANSEYPKDKIFLAVGFEERDDPQKIAQATKYLNQKIAPQIGGVFTTIHPFGLSDEVPGPGTNRNFIIKGAVKELAKRQIGAEQVFVTTLDADFCLHPQFLAGALHKYLSTPESERDQRSYTGVFLYYNNYWQTTTPMRLIATGTAFWQLAEMVGSDKYINYSSLSINLKPLLDIGGWMPDRVNDDSGFYWKAYYHFQGNYKVVPHFMPISADAVLDVNLTKTFQNQYLQLKRWAYGVEHIPFIIKQYFKNPKIDFWDKTDKLLFILWSYLKWGTLALFITFGGILVPLINPTYAQSVVAYNLPVVSSWILTAAFLGLFATIYVHEKTAPQRPKNWSILQRLWSYLQWVMVPLVLVTIATLPAIDAQTSLMLGRYLEFRVTTKARVT